MVRALALLLLLLASSAAPQFREAAFAANEVRAAQLERAQVGTLEGGVAKSSASVERSPLPPGPPEPPAFLLAPSTSFPPLRHTEVVVQPRPPRRLACARKTSLRDQRPSIRRLRHRAPSLDTASSNT